MAAVSVHDVDSAHENPLRAETIGNNAVVKVKMVNLRLEWGYPAGAQPVADASWIGDGKLSGHFADLQKIWRCGAFS
jgi:hypothetical protein